MHSALPSNTASNSEAAPPKKRKHRNRKKRDRRQSFLAPSESTLTNQEDDEGRRPSLLDGPRQSSSLYRLQSGNRSNTSLESEALLDHRDQLPFRSRRKSNSKDMYAARSSISQLRSSHRKNLNQTPGKEQPGPNQSRLNQVLNTRIQEDSDDERDIDAIGNDRTPLLASSQKNISNRPSTSRTGTERGMTYGSSYYDMGRHESGTSPDTRRKGLNPYKDEEDDFDVNNPPSMPGSPKLGSLDDVMIAEECAHQHRDEAHDAIIDIDHEENDSRFHHSSPGSPRHGHPAEMDVCFPHDAESEMDDFHRQDERRSPRRRRRRQWPDLDVLDEWSRDEKEEREAEQVRS